MVAEKHVAIVCPHCGGVEVVENGVVPGWTYEVNIVELDRAVEMDENLNYELEDTDVDTVETHWIHNGCGYRHDVDIADLGVVFHIEQDKIVLDKVGAYWRTNINALKNILTQKFGKTVE